MTETSPVSPPASERRADPRLVGLNVGLLCVLGLAVWSNAQPGAAAGPGTGARARGEYTFVSGRMQGSSAHAVYILDGANREMAAIKWDRSRARFEPVGHRDLAADALYFQPSR